MHRRDPSPGLRRALVAALTIAAIVACGPNEESSQTGRLCTPGAYVFCRCANQVDGTKLCRDDGRAFEACATGPSGECVGGEIQDPDTGKPVDPPPVDPLPVTNDLEACPGKPTSVVAGQSVTIEGDTTAAVDDLRGSGACTTGSGGPDHVYRLQPTKSGTLTVYVEGQGPMNPVIYLRASCASEASQVECAETTGPAGLEAFELGVAGGTELFLVVDGASASAGKYTLIVDLVEGPVCGDGVVTTNEACDDGNKAAGDGCSSDCMSITGNPQTANGCPGQPVHLWPGKTVTGTGSNVGYGNTWNRTGNTCSVSTTLSFPPPEHVYEVVPHKTGNMTVSLTPDAGVNLMLVARRTCVDPATQGAGMCSNVGSVGQPESMTFAVTDGQKVYVAVDGGGNTGTSGGYTVSFQLP